MTDKGVKPVTDTGVDPVTDTNVTATTPARVHLAGYPVILPNRRDPRLRLTVVTLTLHVLGQVAFNFNLSIAQILVSLSAAGLVEFVVTFRRKRIIVWPASALLSGNGVALILRVPGTEHGDWWSTRGWYIFAATAAAAVASKYVIRWRGSHIFNPSNLTLVATFVILGELRVDPQILWWGPWSLPIAAAFVVILLGSLAITLQVGQMRTAAAFWVPFAALVGVIALSGHAITTNWHVGPLGGWSYWVTLVTSPEVLVFLFFMITDPKTSPDTNKGKVVFGFSIALVSAVLISTQIGEFGTKVGILAGLVILCPFVPLINARTGDQIAGSNIDGQTPPLGSRLRPVGAAVIVVVVSGVAIFFVGSYRSVERPASGSAGSLDRRDEVELPPDAVPRIELDDSAATSAFRLTPTLADKVGTDAATDLVIEANAVARRDQDLAAAAVTGARLEQVRRFTEGGGATDATQSQGEPVHYEFESVIVTLFKPDDGPQTPPELAVRIKGSVAAPAQSEPGRAIRFDHWFTVAKVGDFYLITNAYDADRKVVPPNFGTGADGGGGGLNGPGQPATTKELAGLQLSDRAAELGLVLPHSRFDLGEGQNFKIGGAAVGDFDNDGLPDIFLTRVGYPNVLYHNDGEGFTEVTTEAGLSRVPATEPVDEGSTAAMFIDLDGDGNLDLVTLGMPGTPNRLFMGDGNGHFQDRTSEWNFPEMLDLPKTSLPIGLAATDFDRDGHVDLLVLTAEPDRIRKTAGDRDTDGPCSPAVRKRVDALQPAESHTMLLRNNGRGFDDATSRLGVEPSRISASAARFVDVDGDGWDDLVIVGDDCTSKLLMNAEGTFVDRTSGSGFQRVALATGVATLDVDGDGRVDLFTTGAAHPPASGVCSVPPNRRCSPNHLFVNIGGGRFEDRTKSNRVQFSGWSWGAATADLNNDSFDDLLVTSGLGSVGAWRSKTGEAVFDWNLTGDSLWLGAVKAPMRWVDFNKIEGENVGDGNSDAVTHNGRTVIAADFNRDGRVDLLVVNSGSAPSLFMNTTVNDNQWIGVSLLDEDSANRAGIGAMVTVELTSGETHSRRVGVERSYQGAGPASVHFGLGGSEKPAKLTVRWPDGATQTVENPLPDQRILIRRSR